jgi:transitional endoplasmic reticulum ATPase
MPPLDDFIHISTGSGAGVGASTSRPTWNVSGEFFNSTKGERPWTEGLIVDSLRSHHPKHHLTVVPAFICDLLAFANARDDVTYFSHGDPAEALMERQFMPPARRYGDKTGGAFADRVVFGCYDYVFKDNIFLVYIVEGSDTLLSKTKVNYILVEDLKQDNKAAAQRQTDELIAECTKWGQELHNEVLVFDQGFWQKSPELWQNIRNSNWEDVILEEGKKKAIVDDVLGFFDGAERYKEFGVPWKARDLRAHCFRMFSTD